LKKILVIETSATLRHGLIKSFANLSYEVVSVKTYQQGLEQIAAYQNGTLGYQVVALVFGWPGKSNTGASAIIDLLAHEALKSLPTLVMALEVDPVKLNWVVQRRNAALLLWDDYTDVAASLAKLLEKQDSESGLEQTPLAPDNARIRVLLVDDSPTVRVFYQRLFNQHGFETDVAECYEEAKQKAESTHYDIAVIDYFMPDANGDALCRTLRTNPSTQHIEMAIFTATYREQVIKDSLNAGAIECMFKNEADELIVARLRAIGRTVNARRKIQAEKKRLAGILSSVGDGVYGVDADAKITFINPAACKILGYQTPQELIGCSPHDVFHYAGIGGVAHLPEACFLHQAYGEGGELQAWETVFWDQQKQPIPVECTVYPLHIDGQLQGSVIAFRDISERKLMEEELKWQVNHDHLTKLLNRHYFDDELKKEVLRLRRSNEISALLYIDLDRFKYLNDTAGHSAGDQLLIEVGQQLSARLRASDLLARLGGDEFAVILRNVQLDLVGEMADQFRHVLHNCQFFYQGVSYKIDGSVGVSLMDKTAESPDEVLAHADIACHIAKQKGRNQTHIYKAEDKKMSMDLELGWSARLQDALQQDLFKLHYQPISRVNDLNVDNLPDKGPILHPGDMTAGLRPSHYEVLIRLSSKDGAQTIYPNAFLPTAERFNLMKNIDRWVIEHAVKRLVAVNAAQPKVTFAINLSGHSLGDDSLLSFIIELMNDYHADPSTIIFEITETSAISNMESAQRLINELSAIGVRFSLDDFGCGFSSFAHLKQLQASYIKIDGMFVQGMLGDPIDQAMVRSMNDIAHSLGKKTIAEFVENKEIFNKLKSFGVDYVQGYFIGKPTDHIFDVVSST